MSDRTGNVLTVLAVIAAQVVGTFVMAHVMAEPNPVNNYGPWSCWTIGFLIATFPSIGVAAGIGIARGKM